MFLRSKRGLVVEGGSLKLYDIVTVCAMNVVL